MRSWHLFTGGCFLLKWHRVFSRLLEVGALRSQHIQALLIYWWGPTLSENPPWYSGPLRTQVQFIALVCISVTDSNFSGMSKWKSCNSVRCWNLTMHSHVEMTCGFACNVAGYAGILGSVIELSLVDLQVTPAGKNAHTSRGLCKHLCVHFKSLQLRVYFFIWLISNLQGLAILEPGQSGRWNSIGLALQSYLSVQQHGHVLRFTLPRNIRRNCNRTEMATDLLLYHNYLDWSSKIECC